MVCCLQFHYIWILDIEENLDNANSGLKLDLILFIYWSSFVILTYFKSLGSSANEVFKSNASSFALIQ